MKRCTYVPNVVFDKFLTQLAPAELKVLLVVIRQTNGWCDKENGGRKKRDRISTSQFMTKANLSRRSVAWAVRSLVQKELITVSDLSGGSLSSRMRQGKSSLYFSPGTQLVQLSTPTCAVWRHELVQPTAHNKRNRSKETITKERTTRPKGMTHIAELLRN